MYVRSILVDLSAFVNVINVCFVVIHAQISPRLLGCFHRGAVYSLISTHIDSDFTIANRLDGAIIATICRRKRRNLTRAELYRSLHQYPMHPFGTRWRGETSRIMIAYPNGCTEYMAYFAHEGLSIMHHIYSATQRNELLCNNWPNL